MSSLVHNIYCTGKNFSCLYKNSVKILYNTICLCYYNKAISNVA